MRTIGFRCGKTDITYVVLEGTRSSPADIYHKKLPAPVDGARADLLLWLRKEILELLDLYEPARGAYKRIEGNANPIPERIEFEAVLQEACRSHASRLLLTGVLKKQLSTSLRYPGPASTVNNALSSAGLSGLNTAVFGDAAISALFSLPDE